MAGGRFDVRSLLDPPTPTAGIERGERSLRPRRERRRNAPGP